MFLGAEGISMRTTMFEKVWVYDYRIPLFIVLRTKRI